MNLIAGNTGKYWKILLLLVIPIISIILLSYTTSSGFGVSPDSVFYIMGAENIKHGLGYVALEAGGKKTVISLWPPMYSILLAIFGKSINFISIFIMTFLSGYMVYILIGDLILSIITQGFFALNPFIYTINSTIWSENAYLPIVMTIFLFTFLYLNKPERRYMTMLIILSILAVLTRYSGIFLSIFFLTIAILYRKKVFALLSMVPLLTFAAIKLTYALFFRVHQRDVREFGLFLIWEHLSRYLKIAMDTLSDFLIYTLLPSPSPLTLPFAVVFIYAGYRVYRELTDTERNFVKLGLLFTFLYMLSHFLIYITYDPVAVPDNRLFGSTIFVIIVPVLGFIIGRFSRIVAALTLLSMVLINFPSFAEIRDNIRRTSYDSPDYQYSRTLSFIKSLKDTDIIYSNSADLIWYRTRKPSSLLPRKFLANGKPNPEYYRQLRSMKMQLKKGGYIVYMKQFIWRWYLPAPQEILREFPNSRILRFNDGMVIIVPARNSFEK